MNQGPFDLSLFQWIESQTSEKDRQALLSIREALCAEIERYRYLEVGSHLGGSIQPHIADPRCISIISIDPRPLEQPDDRWTTNYRYDGNSTGRMLTLLSAIPGANIAKMQTFESTTSDLSSTSISASVDFAFIDGEHTNPAVVRDFFSVRRFLASPSVLAFHDCFVTPKAFREIRRALRRHDARHQFLYFPASNVVAIVFESTRLTEALLTHGWQANIPISRWLEFRQFLMRHFPQLYSILRNSKNFLTGH